MSERSRSGDPGAESPSPPWRAFVDSEPLRRLLAHSAEITALTDADAKLVWASPSLETLTGYPLHELLGTSPEWLLHPDDVAGVATVAVAAPPSGSAPFQFRLRHRDGTWRRVEAVYSNLIDDPTIGGMVIHAREVTDEAELAEIVHSSDEVFQRFALSAPVGILFTDGDARATYVNDRWLEITGMARADAHDHCWLRATHPDDRRALVETTRTQLAHAGVTSFEHRVVRPDGRLVWVRGQTVIVHDDTGKSAGHVTALEDVTEQHEMRERESQLGALVQRSQDMVSIYDKQGNFVYASPSHERVLGFTPEELVGTSPVDLLHPSERKRVITAFEEQVFLGAGRASVEHRIRCKDGSWRYVESVAVDMSDDPAVGGTLVNARDVTDRHDGEQLAAEQARILESIARGAPLSDTLDAVVAMIERRLPGAVVAIGVADQPDRMLRIVAAPNVPAECRAALDGYPLSAEHRPEYPGDFVVAEIGTDVRRPSTSEKMRDLGYQTFWATRMAHPDGQGRLGGLIVLRPDVRPPTDAERRLLDLAGDVAAIAIDRDRAQARLAHQASHDALTGLPNRDVVLERLRTTTLHPRRGGSVTAVLFLDIDRFKVLNDSIGHDAGDRLLVEMGARLQSALRPGDLIARFGGDEFVMVCEGIDDPESAYELAGRMLDIVRRPFTVMGRVLMVTASVGIALVDGRPPEELLRDADAAMYWAKERGRARAELFDDQLRERVVERLDTERDLRHAVDVGAFEVHYQPVVEITTGKLAGFEALLRWPHPTRGLLEPDAFLSVAEETGLMRSIGAWVRTEAFGQVAKWRAAHPEWGDFVTSINLSAAELVDPQLGANIELAIREAGVDAHVLAVEITERMLFEDPAAARILLAQLRALGVYLGLDDFGTGQSPLLHLKEFPIHALKIDCAFVAGLGKDRFDDAIVDAVIGLAKRLDLLAIAEGIETAEQAEYLGAAGCFLGQGRYFAPPLPPDEAERACLTGSVSFEPDS